MSVPTLINGLTYEETAIVNCIVAYPKWDYVQVWRAVKPQSRASNETASRNVQEVLERAHVQAYLQAQQKRSLEIVDREIDAIDARQYDIAVTPITDGLSPEGDILPPSQWTERFKGAVESYKVRVVGTLGKDGLPIIEKQIKMHNPTASAELVYKRRGLIKPPDVKGGDTYNLTRTEVMVIGLVGDPEARRALDVLAERLEGQPGGNGG